MNEQDLIAERAGICVKFPAHPSEYQAKFESKMSPTSTAAAAALNAMTLRPDQLRDHAVRIGKYQTSNGAARSNLAVTGNSEQRVRYQWSSESEKTVTGKIRVTRDDFARNPFFNQYPPYFEGRTEYAQRYVRPNATVATAASSSADRQWQQHSGSHAQVDGGEGSLKTSLVINPSIELENATNGRPMAESAQTGLGHTVYRQTFKWPEQEPRKERFEWLNN